MIISLTTFIWTIVELVLFFLCLSAICFYCYAIYAGVVTFSSPHPINPDFHPPVTILKPICGLDSEAYENIASFCQQDYPEYQLIFAVQNKEDPGRAVVNNIIDNFPDLDIQVVVTERIIGTNLKISNLANAVSFAKHEILLIADSDIRVGRDYLRRVVQPFQDKSVGVVTCLYRSLAQGWVAILEALGTATEFQSGVLVSKQLEGIKFALGSTIVIRKNVLEAIGGFSVIADYLADDFQLGYLPAQAGYKVVLSDYVVEHVLSNCTLADSIRRQIRWARGTRVSRPWGYLGLIFTYGTATSLLFLIVTRWSFFGWFVLGVTWTIRLVMAWFVGVIFLKDSLTKKFILLVPLWDTISFGVWCHSFVGNTIEWRGRKFKLTKGGKLELIQM